MRRAIPRRRLAFALLAAASAAAAAPAGRGDPCAAVDWATATWDPYYIEDGIQVWRKDITGCPLIAFRGRGTISEPIGKVLGVILDTRREPEWIEGLKETRVVRTLSASEDYEYARMASGFFMIEDREVVSHNILTFDRRKRRAVVDTSSIDLPDVPRRKGTVLARIEHSAMIIAPEDGGRETSFTMEALFDPRGRVPKWMVNLFQKKFPVQTIRRIRAQARRADVVEYPGTPGLIGL
ncbi:MAG: START domain-containing protein [Elusimicrobiota bacterium]